jgi:putative transposase
MDLIANALFRVTCTDRMRAGCDPGIYRVILNEQQLGRVVGVLIEPEPQPETETKRKARGGRPKKKDEDLVRPRKKPPKSLVGELLWLDRTRLQQLHDDKLLHSIERERSTLPELCARSQAEYDQRIKVMSEFLDFKQLQESIIIHRGLAGLVASAKRAHGVSRAFIYAQWSNLCRYGIDERSLTPRRDRCGAPGVARPCDPSPDGGRTREKAGRKTSTQRVAKAYGEILPPEQPGMSSDWAEKILAADGQIPAPKPNWSARCTAIRKSVFVSKIKEVDDKVVLVLPAKGLYPNNRQIRRVVQREKSRIERILEKTTKKHFKMAHRGLTGRNWEGVAGPGHTWAIDSTIGDIYLRSSINRAWIVGRPIVYVIVDVWSTAVLGFYVCLTGPSWNTAKVSLFTSAADPTLVGELWGYVPVPALDPAPTLCYSLLCDRGEYLSQGHRTTALKLSLPLTSYTPPYRGDLKGLAEVLHRIAKDGLFLFVPGAMDYRRKELELRKIDPATAIFTVRDFVHKLYLIFTKYNLTANREHRMDALMLADGVYPSPAGLWHWGHAVGIGFRRHIPAGDLITQLLPADTGIVVRDGVRRAGCHYMSDMVKEDQWTTIARNCGSWEIPASYFPGAMGPIWIPNHLEEGGVLRLKLADESRVSEEATLEEWLDCVELQRMRRSDVEHHREEIALREKQGSDALIANAKRLTEEALAKASGTAPNMSEARQMEVAATTGRSHSEARTAEALRDEAVMAHEAEMAALLRSVDQMGMPHG